MRKSNTTRRRPRDQDRAFRKWTKSEDAQLVRQVNAGMPVVDIAAAHHRSTKGVEARASKLGVGPLNHSKPKVAPRPKAQRSSSVTTAPKKGIFQRLFKR